MQNFVHLRLHSEFSVTDSILRIDQIVKFAHKDNMLALSLTDSHNTFGLVKFYKAARDHGIKPIIGAELNIISDVNHPIESNQPLTYKVILLAKNIEGFRNLCELITRSYIENKILDIPYIKEEWLLNSYYPNLIALSGGYFGDIGILLNLSLKEQAANKVLKWKNAFGDNYYLELQRIVRPNIDIILKDTVEIAAQYDIPVVATHPIQFESPEDYSTHEVRVCIARGEQVDSLNRKSEFTREQYFLTQAQMCELFKDIPSAITNTVEIAKRCNLEITLGKYYLPQFELPENITLEEYVIAEALKGLNIRLKEMYSDEIERTKVYQRYQMQLEMEIETIIQMGFVGYFLIVADFINWAKENNIPVGPGRGSGAGSLVAFCLGITDVDPLHYGLLFERFLNPERVSMPDFDIDFCQDKRELVIEYVKGKYGSNAVSQISTFGTMSSKAVIKDVGRALSLPYGLCDSLTKLILNTPAKSYSLLEAYEKFPELTERIDNADDEVKRLWEISLKLEDLTRSIGKHAAGVLIAPSSLTDFCPLYVAEGMQTSQLDKDDVEQIGLVKFDFLGLRNLTIIQETVENIKTLFGKNITLPKYDFDDPKVYTLLQSGNSSAIFQLESPGMRRVLVKLAPDRFEDIIALLALYRPGPLGSGMVDDFIKRKKGEAPLDYFHENLKECLEPTYGVIVYQEQVMQISQIIGGYTLGGADLLRRAMGKKKPEEMAKHKNIFVEGAIKKGYTKELAQDLFDLMAKFAEYGFNKSHSTAYAIISYHTAYLKTYYLSCFMAATLSSELDKTDKLYEFYQDCLSNNLTILPPDINSSYYKFTPTDECTIRYALGALKGIGSQVVELIVTEREQNGEFISFVDFCKRVDRKVLNKKTMESLIKAGCFDKLEPNRAKLFNNIAKVIKEIDQLDQNASQASLFEELDNYSTITLLEYEPWNFKEMLHMEKQALGFYFSGSLFEEYRYIVNLLNIKPLSSYSLDNDEVATLINNNGFRSDNKTQVMIAGIISNIGSRPTKRGGKIAFINIEDDSSSLEFVLFNEEFDSYKHLLKIDEMVIVEGELMYDSFREQIKLTAKKLYTLDEVLSFSIKDFTLTLNSNTNIDDLQEFFTSGGHVKVKANYINHIAKCSIEFGENFKFTPTFANLTKLRDLTDWSLSVL